MLMALVFLLQGCRTETINEENNRYSHEVTKTLYDMQKVPQFSSFISRAKSKKENSKNSLNTVNDKSKVLVITKPDITSYSTLVWNADSGFEILVYSVDKNGKESFYRAKYIPENKTVNNKIENFTGKVEFSNETGELLQTVRYSNGVVVNTNEKSGINSKSSPCHYYVTITAVRCTAGDGHAPGEACSGTADQQPYYDVYVSQYCNQEQDAGGFTTGSGSYGGTGEYGSYGGGFNALELIMSNTDAYHWNLFNQLSADNRTKIYELLMYNAIDGSMYNFMISFFNQNPTTTAEQFQGWFLEEPISGLLQNELFEDWADPTRVKPTIKFKKHAKLNSIYNKIKTAANFKQYLQNFEPTFSVAHLMFDIGPNQISNAIAETTEPQNYWIKITFNQDKDFANMPKVLIAYTFMHEMIHAEMLRKLLSISSTPQGNIDWNLVKSYNTSHNYPGLFDYYIRFMHGNTNYQHEAMGAHYVNIMVNFLKQVYGTHYTNTEYETIVWMGLQGTTAWNLLPQSKKDLYTNTWNTNYWLWEI